MGTVAVWALAAPGQQASAKLAVTTETFEIMFREIFTGCCVFLGDGSPTVLQLNRSFRLNGTNSIRAAGPESKQKIVLVFAALCAAACAKPVRGPHPAPARPGNWRHPENAVFGGSGKAKPRFYRQF
jgi:hypothetical protein